MPQLSVIVSNEVYEIVKAVLAATGKSQSSGCGEWIYRGAVSELRELQKVGIIPKPLPVGSLSIPYTPPDNNGKSKTKLLSLVTDEQVTDTLSITDKPKYEEGTVIRIIKVPKSMRHRNLINENGIVSRQTGKGKWLIYLANGTEVELPEAYIEPEENVR